MFTAILDTSVLWPSLQRDFLLSLAVEGLYRPVWSAAILAELEYSEAHKLIKRGEPEAEATRRARHLIEQMRATFNDAEAKGWEPLDGTYDLPDPDDEHVVAAAVVAGAGVIVTRNHRDFPEEKLPAGIQVLPPTEFAANTVAIDPLRARAAIGAMAARSGNRGPSLSGEEILDALADRYAMVRAVELVRRVG